MYINLNIRNLVNLVYKIDCIVCMDNYNRI